MGYEVSIRGCDFLLPKDKYESACKAIDELMTHTELMSGGAWRGAQGKTDHWFAWVRTEEVLKTNNLIEKLEEWRFEVFENEIGIIDFAFDGKMGDEEQLFKTLAPFVRDGSTIEWVGEDSEFWRWVFINGKMIDQTGHITYPEIEDSKEESNG